MQLIIHDGAPAALAGAERFHLTADIAALPHGRPTKRRVCFKCLYAREVLACRLPGPYRAVDAEGFAALMLDEDDR